MLWLILFACKSPTPDTGVDTDTDTDTDGEAAPELWASAYNSDAVGRFDAATGEALGQLADVPGAQAILPWDGGALVVAEKSGEVHHLRLDGSRSVWADGLANPTGLALLPDGNVAIGSFSEDRVLRYTPEGTLIDVLAEGLDGADAGMAVDGDGRLWVPCWNGNHVVVLDDGVEVLTIDLVRPRVVRIVDGEAWVSAWTAGQLRRYAMDGSRLDDVARRDGITGFAVTDAEVWIASDQTPEIDRVDRATGDALGQVASGLDGVTFLQSP